MQQSIGAKSGSYGIVERTAAAPVTAGSLVTIAYLKAKLDEGSDQLGIFMPLVLDSVKALTEELFLVSDVQQEVARRHGLAMPEQTVATLLKRAAREGLLHSDSGAFRRSASFRAADVSAEKQRIRDQQRDLADRLATYARQHGADLGDADSALDKLLAFMENAQVAVLLAREIPHGARLTSREELCIADFLQMAMHGDEPKITALEQILTGMVLYRAAFLLDLSEASRRFSGLLVYFDSGIVRHALGYEGSAAQRLTVETVMALRSQGARCIVLRQTVAEIRRILNVYERHVGTAEGRRSLRQSAMSRHMLTSGYSPSDVAQMIIMLEKEISAAGFEVRASPTRIAAFTSGEKKLAERLVNPDSKDELEPRIGHDVDCVAAVLTMRKGRLATKIEAASAVFVTSSWSLVHVVSEWYYADNATDSVPPAIQIAVLTNLAWLKKPRLCSDLPKAEIIVLCAAALRPRADTWQRFLRHLDALTKASTLGTQEEAAILISGLADRLLREAETNSDQPEATDFNEVVERVKQSYMTAANEAISTSVRRSRPSWSGCLMKTRRTLKRTVPTSFALTRVQSPMLDAFCSSSS